MSEGLRRLMFQHLAAACAARLTGNRKTAPESRLPAITMYGLSRENAHRVVDYVYDHYDGNQAAKGHGY